ncbi:hypothetical protein WN944_026707 [Citrus x changshan-huyou]|uniref:Uncharacterized protein n=1 Tax=Citrus x changshan-huyou TaxID=2935761 RepID=A0AAP0LSV6_9ROSI
MVVEFSSMYLRVLLNLEARNINWVNLFISFSTLMRKFIYCTFIVLSLLLHYDILY